MHISELADSVGVPLATVKFYLREGLLPKGTKVSATRAEYDDGHAERLRLIGALASVQGLPLARMREILGVVDRWDDYGVVDAVGAAVAALPPYAPEAATEAAIETSGREYPEDRAFPNARAAVAALDLAFDPGYPATRQLEDAIRSVQRAGLVWSPEVAASYGDALAGLTAAELAPMRDMSERQSIEYAVLGTALYEPVILAIRRLLHRDLAERLG